IDHDRDLVNAGARAPRGIFRNIFRSLVPQVVEALEFGGEAQSSLPMLWFFALTEDSTAFRQYAEMLKVAVHTAKKFTSLVPHFIYDGSDNDFTAWLRRHDVQIIRHRSLFRDSLAALGRKKGNPHFEAAL